ncbi:hypothetical protein KIN20_002925 [Parelaphostrongylus tenuis]|uniref:protein disulfide-isomerase n=1 Tax=Parelaphostrongylus tenuis TaxID=148309 RepID=A0AAD5QDV5_PARTN|nr:hypothetical protein KIN20_002925 [Parelaphostrongylus tenuis]
MEDYELSEKSVGICTVFEDESDSPFRGRRGPTASASLTGNSGRMKWTVILLLLSARVGAEEASSETQPSSSGHPDSTEKAKTLPTVDQPSSGDAKSSDKEMEKSESIDQPPIGDTESFDKDGNVYVLTDNTFDSFIKQYPTFLAMFYSPTCVHCKNFAPLYNKAAASIPSVPFVRVDATVERELAKRYDITGYPTLKFWRNGEGPEDYDVGRDVDEILDWLRSRTDPNYKPKPDDVVTLTSENFDEFISNEALSLVEFYAPWCGHCKNLAPEYERAAKYLKAQGTTIKLAKVDATVEKDLASKYGVEGFPTLMIMRHGRRFDYNGPRDGRGIANYMIEQSKPAAKKLSNVGSIERFMERDDVTIVGFFTTDSSSLEAYSESAERAERGIQINGIYRGFEHVEEI